VVRGVRDAEREFFRLAGSAACDHGALQTRTLSPVSSRTSLCRSRQFLPGKDLARPETGAAIFADDGLFPRQIPGSLAFPSLPPAAGNRSRAGLGGGSSWIRSNSLHCADTRNPAVVRRAYSAKIGARSVNSRCLLDRSSRLLLGGGWNKRSSRVLFFAGDRKVMHGNVDVPLPHDGSEFFHRHRCRQGAC
jgi:hypothetical protein